MARPLKQRSESSSRKVRFDAECRAMASFLRWPSLLDSCPVGADSFMDQDLSSLWSAVESLVPEHYLGSIPILDACLAAGISYENSSARMVTRFKSVTVEHAVSSFRDLKLIALADNLRSLAVHEASIERSPSEYLEAMAQAVAASEDVGDQGGGVVDGLTSFTQQLAEKDREISSGVAAVPSGMGAIDKFTPLRGGEVMLLAGAGGAGKSTLARQIRRRLASTGVQSLSFEMENTPAQLFDIEAHVALGIPMNQGLTLEQYYEAQGKVEFLGNIIFDPRPARTPMQMRATARKYPDAALIVIDTAKQVSVGKDIEQWRKVEIAAEQAKILAKETGAHVLLLAHLKKNIESSHPCLDDVFGRAVTDPDNVVVLWRKDGDPDYEGGRARLYRLKARGTGGLGYTQVQFNHDSQAYREMVGGEDWSYGGES